MKVTGRQFHDVYVQLFNPKGEPRMVVKEAHAYAWCVRYPGWFYRPIATTLLVQRKLPQ